MEDLHQVYIQIINEETKAKRFTSKRIVGALVPLPHRARCKTRLILNLFHMDRKRYNNGKTAQKD